MRITHSVAFVSCILLLSCSSKSDTPITISGIKCNGFSDPEGIGMVPDFSWTLISEKRGQKQSAYQIIVGSDKSVTDKYIGDNWDSGMQPSGKTAWITYKGKTLKPEREYFWRVRIRDGEGNPSSWSTTGKFYTGLFTRSDWCNAKWMGFEEIPDSLLLVPGVHGAGNNLGEVAKKRTTIPLFRKEFNIEKKIAKAYVYVSGLGHYELYINGIKAGNRFLSPGWSDYRKTVFYNTFDVTENLKRGNNAISTIVGNGFYNINRERYRKLVIAYGTPKLILKLTIKYTDGTEDIVISDETWKTSPSPVTYSGIYGGEDYDARLEQSGWDNSGFNDNDWKPAMNVREPEGVLRPETDFPVQVKEVISNKKISRQQDSCYVYDFEQNCSGIIKIKVKGRKAQVVRFTPGELLGEDSLVTQQATGAPYYFSYTLKGDGEEIWMPRFTYYGFRYVQVTGAAPINYPNPGKLPVITDFQMLHTRNSSPEVGSFKCSSELFNSIYDLINWSIRSNLASVATDCPHREKLGWLEQTHLMGNSIKFIYDIHNLYDKVINDMIEAQLENGLVPDIAPEYVPFAGGFRDSPEWGSACIILPWDMYEWYSDTTAVRKAYPMMKRYLAYLNGMSENNILSHGLGDWYDLGPRFPGEAQLTPKALTATSVYFYDAKLLGKMAGILGIDEDAANYKNLAEEIRISFNNKFFNPVTKVYSTGSQTAYSMPLFFGMVDDSCRKDVVQNLIASITGNNKALTAGDVGYRYLLRVLEQEGQSQLIYEMNSRIDVPGYGYQLSKGATALTESWAALKYVSNNHMMLGHLMEWFYSGIGGIRQASGSSGFEKLIVSPEIVGDVTWAETRINTNNGVVSTSWKIENEYFTLRIAIPVNSEALVYIPQADADKITENDRSLNESECARFVTMTGDKTIIQVASGEYLFKTTFIK